MIELTDKEQAVLNAACAKIEKANSESQGLRRAADEAARKADAVAHEARGVYRSIMELSGRNPDAHQVNWDGSNASVTELPAKPDNVVALPTPEDRAASADQESEQQ